MLDEVFGIEGDFFDHRSTLNIGNPDRVFVRTNPPPPTSSSSSAAAAAPGTREQAPKARLVIEFKTPWALELPDNLAEAYNRYKTDPGNKITKSVQQLYGYMSWNDVQVGVLSIYTSTFFFQRDEEDGLRVSRKFEHTDREARSVVVALLYVCHFAATEGYYYFSPVTGAPPGTYVMDFDSEGSMIYRGAWSRGLTIPWGDMQILLDNRLSQNYATVVTADLRHKNFRKPSNAVYEKIVICKIYDLTSPTSAAQAHNEIQMYMNLEHLQGERIPKLYAAGTHCGILQIMVMEKCGEPVLANPKPFRGFWKQVREALRALHDCGFIHGDIRLENFTVVTSRSGKRRRIQRQVRLIDFADCSAPDRSSLKRLRLEELKTVDELEEEIGEQSEDDD
ncbi:hypothetical protein ABW21_db0206463 [Orbilia brochopaga]|nr:hypothetical protein ABW21_db0206463 [Drechslerella brochopaga]